MGFRGPFIINLVVILGVSALLFLFDCSLDLGRLNGTVFSLYLLYGSVGVVIVNTIVAIVRKDSFFFLAGLVVSLVGVVIAYGGGWLLFS